MADRERGENRMEKKKQRERKEGIHIIVCIFSKYKAIT